jgi:ATP-dependent Clp protease ATP-binding subunit ClpB
LNPLARLLIDGGVRTGETTTVTVETLPNGETELSIHRNHAPGSASTEEENLLDEHMAPVGDEESINEDEFKKDNKDL